MYNNKSRSNLAIGCNAANWGLRLQTPLPVGNLRRENQGQENLGCDSPASSNIPLQGDRSARTNTMLLWTKRVSLPNGISFRLTALAERTSAADDNVPTYIHTDGQTTLW